MDAIEEIDLSVPGVPSLVLRDLSDYITLPFLAAFDVHDAASASKVNRPPQKRVTYIALSKRTMPHVVKLFLQIKEDSVIYNDGTVEAILSVCFLVNFGHCQVADRLQAYSIPVKLKYECPAPSKFGKDLPLWKTATTSLLQVVKECGPHIPQFGDRKNSSSFMSH